MPSPPRRSTRGAAPAAPASTGSSSLASTRQDRNSRGGTLHKSTTPRSLSSEDISEPPRRSQRAQPTHKDDDLAKADEAIEDMDDEAVDEEEITRCICGQQDYPGLPLAEVFASMADAQLEDAGGLFILCDGCSVWQHGGCVGILEDSQSPDKYFCEQCRPKLHAISTDSRGQKFSLYLPLHPKASLRKGSVSKHDDKAKKERESVVSRASVDPATGKRRATMRSKEHDDEEEQIRIAIEESKREVQGKAGNGRRSTKRGRDDSSEDSSKQDSKRQRRLSESVNQVTRTASVDEESDDQLPTTSKAKRAKLEANLTARQAEQDKREKEREMARVEAAGRRQERARSRRNDDAEAADETTPKPTPSAKPSPPPPSSQPSSPPPAEKIVVKKGPGKKTGKKLGNNQYTKPRLEAAAAAAAAAASSPHGRKKTQNQVSGSGDEASEGPASGDGNGNSKNSPGPAENGGGSGKGKFGRGKKAATNGNGSGEPPERTFTNMQAALMNMGAFVDKHKPELDTLRTNSEGSPQSTPGDLLMMLGGAVQPPGSDTPQRDERPEEELSAYEMGLKLQRGIEAWQREWGHLAGSASASTSA